MNKLYRSLVAGLAVIGLVGCGDDVTIPPQPINVTVTPNGISIPVGGTQQMAAAVSGGSGGATIAWTTSSPTVASVDGSGLVTGVAPGSAGITATATASDGTTGQGSATITVTSTQTTPATISIGAITNLAGTPVLLAAAAGQLNVALNLERGGESIQRVDLLLDDQVVGTQNFTLLANKEAGEEFDVIEVLTISFNSASFDPATGLADFLNGPHTLSARVVTAQNQQGTVSPSIALTLANVSVVNLSVSASGASANNPGTGILWSTGDLMITAIPVVFTAGAPVVNQVTIIPGGGLNAKTITAAPFTATWAKGTSTGNGGSAGVEAVLAITATSAVGGAAGPNGAAAFNLDNKGPAAPTVGAMPIWVNGAFAFTAGASAATGVVVGADAGVSGVTAAFFVGAVTALPGTGPTSCSTTGLTEVTQANETDIPGTIVSTVYRGRVVTQDALANQTCAALAPGGVSAATFGADYIAPTATESTANPAQGDAFNAPGAQFQFALVDNASGFSGTPLAGVLRRLNPNGTTTCVSGAGSACNPLAVAVPFNATAGTNLDGYYTFSSISVRDQALNAQSFPDRTYLLDQVAAVFTGGMSLQSLYVGGAQGTFSASATDNLDLNNVFGTVGYATGALQFPTQPIGTFGAPLETSATVTFTISSFIRCLNVANDFAATGNQANAATLSLSDFAQAAPTVLASAIPATNVEACGIVGNVPTGDLNTFAQNLPGFPTGKSQVDISGTGLATASSETVTLTAEADVAINTSVDPFARVVFYYETAPASGVWVEIGQGSASLAQTPTNRIWTYTIVWNPGSNVPVGSVRVTAIGVDSNGDAVFSFDDDGVNPPPSITVTTVP